MRMSFHGFGKTITPAIFLRAVDVRIRPFPRARSGIPHAFQTFRSCNARRRHRRVQPVEWPGQGRQRPRPHGRRHAGLRGERRDRGAQTLPVSWEYVGQTIGSREVEVRARVTGILLGRNFKEGERVKKGQSLFTIDPAPFQAAVARAGRCGRGAGAPRAGAA